MSEPTASSSAVTVVVGTLTFSARNSPRTKSARSVALVIRAQGCTSAPRFRSWSASALARPPPECTTTSSGARRQVGGRGGDQRDRVLAGLGGGLQHHHPFVGEQRRAQQFGELAGADLTGAQPVHRDVVGAGLLACATRSTAATARSTSSSSSPRIRCNPGTDRLTRRSCHGAPTVAIAYADRDQRATAPRRHRDRRADACNATSPSGTREALRHRCTGHRRGRPVRDVAAATTAPVR